MRAILILILLFSTAHATAKDLGFRFDQASKKCKNANGAEGLNPSFFGQCGDFMGTSIGGLDWTNVDFRGSRFAASTVSDINFTNANLSYTSFAYATVTKLILTGATTTESDFSHVVFEGDFSGVKFDQVRLTGASFAGATLNGTIFKGNDCAGVVFEKASLTKADLRAGNFAGANFKTASLEGADLSGADFSETDLRSASLKDVKFDNAIFRNARINRKTVLPFSLDDAVKQGMVMKADGFAQMNGRTFVKVPAKGKMTDQAILAACRGEGLAVPCAGPKGSLYTDDKCLDVGWPDSTLPMNPLSQLLCGSYPSECKNQEFEGVFTYMGEQYSGGCGVLGSNWCASGIDHSDQLALCVE